MKRANNLFEQIVDYNNIRLAFLKALKRKRKSSSAILFCQNVDKNLEKVKNRLMSKNPAFGNYRQFKIYDPKERVITAAPFEERVMHHAIMNVLEPIFEKQFIYHTYACRKNKGMHRAVAYAQKQCRKYKYFLKLDVKKYFETINHEILKKRLIKIIKDKRTLNLLFNVVDSFDTGLPIGNLTSQFFANLYLSPLDHFILEKLKMQLVRYMDDFVVWGNDAAILKKSFKEITDFCEKNLRLSLKVPIIGLCRDGLPFLGYLINKKETTSLRKTRIRRVKKMFQTMRNLGSISILIKSWYAR